MGDAGAQAGTIHEVVRQAGQVRWHINLGHLAEVWRVVVLWDRTCRIRWGHVRDDRDLQEQPVRPQVHPAQLWWYKGFNRASPGEQSGRLSSSCTCLHPCPLPLHLLLQLLSY